MRPFVLVPSDVKPVEGQPFHCVGEKYSNAVAHGANVQPLLLPAVGAGLDLDSLQRKMPILAVYRGLQELNVAFGGSLHRAVHEQPDLADHREPQDVSREQMYAAAHDVLVTEGGMLEGIVKLSRFRVNSLHGQAINQLGAGLAAEAVSPDGVIEAVSMQGHFVLGVQWHPEWGCAENPQSRVIFAAFGAAVKAYVDQRVAA